MSYYDDIYEYAADNYGLITSVDARAIGISNVELVKLAHRGRLMRLGYGVYRIYHYVPTLFDKYAEAVALVGNDAYIYGESVLAMHGLALVNPSEIHVAVSGKIRKKLPDFIKIIVRKNAMDSINYEGIPCQTVFSAILDCKATVMTERLLNAIDEAQKKGLISSMEVGLARKELRNGNKSAKQ